MNAEELFLQKYGNKITASESWVIRFAEEYAKLKVDAVLRQPVVRGQLLAFLKWLQTQDMNKALITLVDEYEKASNLP